MRTAGSSYPVAEIIAESSYIGRDDTRSSGNDGADRPKMPADAVEQSHTRCILPAAVDGGLFAVGTAQ